MDLSFSPDFDAFYCYAIVFLVGAFVATSQIRQRIGEIEGIWFIARTWWLFAIYTAVPVGLFWLLDRTGAINDTSFFAAILVGFGYERIITGGSQMVRAPGDVSQFWTPFIAYADRIAKLVRDQDARRRRRLAERIIADVVRDGDRIAALEALARKYAPDIAVLESELKAISDSASKRGEAAAAEQKVRALYNVILTVPDGHDALLSNGVIGRLTYWLYVRRLNSLLAMAAVALACVLFVIVGIWRLEPDMTAQRANYYVWRLGKTNSSSYDQFRARHSLVALLVSGGADLRRQTTERLVYLVQKPALPMERVDLVLSILVSNRGPASESAQTPLYLAQALRAASVDARTRIHEALKLLAEGCGPAIANELAQWKPSNGDSTASLEREITRWSDYWKKPCGPART